MNEVRMKAQWRRETVLGELAAVEAYPVWTQTEAGVRAYHLRFFRGGDTTCKGMDLEQINADLRWLAKEGYIDKVRPAEYRINFLGRARLEQLERVG